MTLRAGHFNRYMGIGAMTLLVNLIIFGGFPNLLRTENAQTDIEYLQAVDYFPEKQQQALEKHIPRTGLRTISPRRLMQTCIDQSSTHVEAAGNSLGCQTFGMQCNDGTFGILPVFCFKRCLECS